MNTLMVNVLKVAIAAALVTGVSACNRSADAGSTGADDMAASADAGVKYGKVVSVDPIRTTVNNPRKVCHAETVTHTAPPKAQQRQRRVKGTRVSVRVDLGGRPLIKK